jgi:hypothetical protein
MSTLLFEIAHAYKMRRVIMSHKYLLIGCTSGKCINQLHGPDRHRPAARESSLNVPVFYLYNCFFICVLSFEDLLQPESERKSRRRTHCFKRKKVKEKNTLFSMCSYTNFEDIMMTLMLACSSTFEY